MGLLGDEVKTTSNKLKVLNEAMSKAKASGLDRTNAEYRRLEREIETSKNKLKSLTKEFELFKAKASSVGVVATKMQKLGNTMKSVGSRMAGVSASVGIIGAIAVSSGAEFDEAMAKVQAISGSTASDFEKLRQKAIAMGEKTKFSASESAEALNYMAMAGWKAEDMIDGLDGVLALASASGTDLAKTSDIVTDGLTAFGLKAKDSGHFADVMATACANANTNVEMMGETFKYVGPVAGAMGYSIEDLALATGLMANSGIKASQSGTALRSMISRMASPTDAVASAMERLGVEISDSEGNARPFREVLVDLRQSMKGLSETEKSQVASSIAGKNAMAGFLAVVNASDEDFNKLANAVDNADGSAQNMADIMNNTFAGQITRIKSALGSMAITISDSVTPALSSIANVVEKVASKINGANPRFKQMIVVMTAIIGVISPLLVGFGAIATMVGASITKFMAIIPAIKKYIAVIKEVGVAQKLAFLSNPIVLAIAGIVAGFILLYKTSETFRNAVKQSLQQISASFQQLWNTLKPAISELGVTLLPVVKSALNVLGSAVAKLLPIVTKVITTSINRITAIISVISRLMSAIKSVGGKIYSTIATPFSKVATKVASVVNTIKSKLSALKNYKWLKAPHLKVSGGKVPYGIGGAGTKPNISIDWYAKAMRQGMILNSPTIFGAMNGKLLGGGEVGSETIVGTNSLMGMITNAVASSMNAMANNIASSIATGMKVATSGASAGGDVAIDVYLFKNGDHLGRTIVNTYDTYKKRLG